MTVPGSANPLLLRSAAPTAYQVSRSLRFNSADSAYLSRTPGSNGTSLTTYTFSTWIKRVKLGEYTPILMVAPDNSDYFHLNFNTSDQLYFLTGENGSTNQNLITSTAVFRDTSAWYHFVFTFDYGNATSSERVRFYVNGTRIDMTGTIAAQNYTGTRFNRSTYEHRIGSRQNTSNFSNLYFAETHFIDGSAKAPGDFAETDATTGQWVPKLYSGGSYGTNGFKLTFADNSNNTASTLGADSSGNGNHFTPSNLSVTAGAGNDALTDSPTSYGTGTSGGDVRGNFATWNPLSSGTQNFLNGNLQITRSSAAYALARGTFGLTSGKWYWEYSCITDANEGVGVCTAAHPTSGTYLGQTADGWAYYSAGLTTSGRKYNNGFSTYGAAWGNGDIIGIAVDIDAQKIWFSKNGTWQDSGNPATGANAAFTNLPAGGPVFPATTQYASTTDCHINFGQRAFAYTPPANYKPLVDTYLPTPTVAKPSEVMDITLYTGNGSARSITGFSFSPDFVWIKNRSNATGHRLLDTVRGATKALISQGTDAEVTESQGLTAFNSDGFSLGTGAFDYNQSGNTYVGWAWDAGTSTVTNTQGSITSTVRANTSAGFSVATWTGTGANATIGHGCGAAPKFFVIKRRDTSSSWIAWHSGIGSTDILRLESTNAKQTIAGFWQGTNPTSTLVYLDADGTVNGNGGTFVGYFWAPVAGYSSFGVWQHNNSNDGPFIYTGFRPKLILLKNSDNAEQWFMFDSSRRTYNLAAGTDTSNLRPNSSGAEGSYSNQATIDFLSNGFKIRTTTPDEIAFGTRSYIYGAWAESPFQYARAR